MSGDLAKPSFSTMGMVLSLSSAFPGCLTQPPSVSRQRRRAYFSEMYVIMSIIMVVMVVWVDPICQNTNFVASG
jgi:hypothetical protein